MVQPRPSTIVSEIHNSCSYLQAEKQSVADTIVQFEKKYQDSIDG